MSITTIGESDYDPIFKRYYFKLADNVYNTYSNIYSLLPKEFGVGGKDGRHPVEVTFGGGVGSSTDGTLPTANNQSYLEPVYTPKRQYARVQIDGLTIESGTKTEHAFINTIDKEVTGKIKSFNRNKARAFSNDGTGILGQFTGPAGGTAAAPTMTILTTGTYRRRKAHFEKGDYVNINSLGSIFEIMSYVHSTGLLTLARRNGADDLTTLAVATHSIYMQNSKDADPYGMLGVQSLGTHYGVAEEFRWSPTEIDSGGAPLDTEMLTQLVEDSETETEECFDKLVFSPIQYRKYIALLESQKRFPVPVDVKPKANKMTSPDLIARVSYGGIQYAGSQGNITVMKHKFLRDDMIWGLNTSKVMVSHVKKPGWAQRDGTVFLRIDGKDAYEARYVSYDENRINVFYQGFIFGLPIT